MKRRTMTVMTALMMVVTMVCGCADRGASTPTPEPETRESGAGINSSGGDKEIDMGFGLLKQVNEPSKNVLVSPYSLIMALGMTYNGAEGETAKQIENVLGQSGTPKLIAEAEMKKTRERLIAADEKITVSNANSIWGDKGFTFNAAFTARNEDIFSAETHSVDFNSPGTAKEINDWVYKATEGKITDIADDLSGARAVLINALYFYAPWTYPFNKQQTQKAGFSAPSGNVSVDMMFNSVKSCLYAEDEGSQMLSLPYGNGSFAMMVILPKAGMDIDDYIYGLDTKSLTDKLASMERKSGDVYLPKFKINVKLDASEALKKMGMTDAFTDSADFSGMTSEKIYISRVNQAAAIDVFEDGTVASAATSVIMERSIDISQDKFSMMCDHPFMFLIYDTKGMIPLFIGKIENPLEV